MSLLLIECCHFEDGTEAYRAFQVVRCVQCFDEAIKGVVPIDFILWILEYLIEKVLFGGGFESFNHARAKIIY